MNLYSLFLLELQKMADKMRIRKAEVETLYLQKRKEQAIAALQRNVPYRRMRDAQKEAADDQ